jgi:hypothetical protein
MNHHPPAWAKKMNFKIEVHERFRIAHSRERKTFNQRNGSTGEIISAAVFILHFICLLKFSASFHRLCEHSTAT